LPDIALKIMEKDCFEQIKVIYLHIN